MESNLEELETRQSSLKRTYEAATAQASSVLKFTVEWEEIGEYIESAKEMLRCRFDEIGRREEEIGIKERELEAEKLRYKVERDSKARDLHRIQSVVEEKEREVVAMERRLSEMEALVKDMEVDCGLYWKRIEDAERKVKCVAEEIRVKEVQLKYVEELVRQKWREYDLNDEKIRGMSKQEKDFSVLKESMEEWVGRVEAKEVELRKWIEKLEEKEKEIGLRIEEVNLIDTLVHECLKEVQLKEQQLHSVEKSLHVQSRGLQKRENMIKMKQEQFDSDVVRENVRPKVNSCQLKDEHLEDIAAASNNGKMDGRGLQLLMNQHLMRNELMLKQIEDSLQESPDPEKLVLDAMDGFYSSNSTVENNSKMSDLTIIRKSCNLLLTELRRVSPKITPQVRGEAMKLAAEWKTKMKTENWLELLGFLLLLAAYDLSSNFDMKELELFVGIVDAQYYDTAELCLALGIRGKAPDQGLLGQSTPKRDPNCSSDMELETPADSPLVDIQRSTPADVSSLQVIPAISNGSGLSSDDLVDLIQDLIAKKELLEAVVISCNFKLTDLFPPVPLLKEYVESASPDNRVYVLYSVIGCVKKFNLESEYPSEHAQFQRWTLESIKVLGEAERLVATTPVKQQDQKRRRSGDPVSDFQPQQQEQQQKKKRLTICYHCREPGHVQSRCPQKC